MTELIPPEGFRLHDRTSPLTEPWGAIFAKTEPERVRLGLFVGRPHTNSRGLLHGGLIAALADNAMGLSLARLLQAEEKLTDRGPITTSLSVDYFGSAGVGQWLEIAPEVIDAGRRSGVVQARVTADGRAIARADAAFRFGSPGD